MKSLIKVLSSRHCRGVTLLPQSDFHAWGQQPSCRECLASYFIDFKMIFLSNLNKGGKR
jgi:hypothetical protein